MDRFIIEGGCPLKGTVTPSGNKNAALPMLASTLLTDQEVVFRNLPRIKDVDTMLQILAHLGVEIRRSFMPTFLRAARRAVPEIPRGLLIHRAYPPALIQAVMAWTGSAALHPAHPLVTPALMALARRRGWQVNAWTVNDPADARRLGALGVHGLIGDVPAALTAARAD